MEIGLAEKLMTNVVFILSHCLRIKCLIKQILVLHQLRKRDFLSFNRDIINHTKIVFKITDNCSVENCQQTYIYSLQR